VHYIHIPEALKRTFELNPVAIEFKLMQLYVRVKEETQVG
jgi:hypothetical protein